jgi:hypothetical protein
MRPTLTYSRWTRPQLRANMNPYRYGYVTEVSYDNAAGKAVGRKWYTMGRVAQEMALV